MVPLKKPSPMTTTSAACSWITVDISIHSYSADWNCARLTGFKVIGVFMSIICDVV